MEKYVSKLGVYIVGGKLIEEENLQKLYKVIDRFKNKYKYKIRTIIFLRTNKFLKANKKKDCLAFTTFPYYNFFKTKVNFINGADIYFNADLFNETDLKKWLGLSFTPESYVEFLIWHELGHVVDYYKSLEKKFSGIFVIKDKIFRKLTSELPFSWNLIDGIITEAGGIDSKKFIEQIGDFINYQNSYAEYFAESFAMVNMNIYAPLSNLIITRAFEN